MKLPAYARRWHAPKHRPAREKAFITAEEIEDLLMAQLGDSLEADRCIQIGDDRYYCPPLEDALEIVNASSLDSKRWTEQKFDCDDFAFVLKAHFAEAAYADGERRAAFAMGIIWGEFDVEGNHAINFLIDEDRELWFIEPQTDEVFTVAESQARRVYMVVV